MNSTASEPVITARGLRKAYKSTVALDSASFSIPSGRIVGLIGPNGAGKTTALKAILGLTSVEGELSVLGRDPRLHRDELMNDICFIADVAVLPRWLKVREAIDSSPACIRASTAPAASASWPTPSCSRSSACASCPRA